MDNKAQVSLARLRPRLEARFSDPKQPDRLSPFFQRLERHFPALFDLLLALYGDQYDFFYHLEEILATAAESWFDRPADLKDLDAQREADPLWFQSEKMLGAVCYVDLFASDLSGLREKIPYFNELGLTYLHLMPPFLAPEDNSDGGYAVSSYREINPRLGTMTELCDLAAELRAHSISLVLDFVFNHTSDEHDWARRALAGDAAYQDFYFMYADRIMPDAYDAYLREIFPDQRAGSFTYRPEIERWVWTTFHDFQWDLNYTNPEVFRRMAEEMLFLANVGVEVLRLDAVAFTWKMLGTSSENLPEAHMLIRAFNAIARLAAPALIFKSEAIVHPDDVLSYISPKECQISYNPLLMALLWEALATRDVRLLSRSMAEKFRVPPGTAWVNYVRSHDDIGWTFSDEDAASLGINAFDHRQFLNAFYTGRFEGSFGRGLPFQYNPRTKDARISGTCASLAGLEKALTEETEKEVALAIRRILLIHSVILSIGGIPLLYLGDEIGALNDYAYWQDPVKSEDSRWVHRIPADWKRAAQRSEPGTIPGRIFPPLQRLVALRKTQPVFACGETTIVDSANQHVFGYQRSSGGQQLLALANFTEAAQIIGANVIRLHGSAAPMWDLVTQDEVRPGEDLVLAPYQFVWLMRA